MRIQNIPKLRLVLAAPCACCGWPLCGQRPVIWNDLADQWKLTPKLRRLMDQREGRLCLYCGTNWRVRHLARVLLNDIGARVGRRHKTVRNLKRDPGAQELKIAEINELPGLHRFLAPLRGLTYSEYGAENSQDLMALTYSDATFDYVLTSDTLEHVPDFDLALSEIRRVLKPGGKHIFTIPVIWDRATRQRAERVSGAIIHHLSPSHHGGSQTSPDDYLVYNEFGSDVAERIKKADFSVALIEEPKNELVVTIVATKPSEARD